MGSRDIARLSLLIALALALYTLESLLPRPLPWLRLGLSNALVLAALLIYGLRLALVVSVSRTLLGSLLIGSFLGPGFVLSISAGVVSCVAMGTASFLGRKALGTTGISVFGALAHNFTQLGLAYLLFIRRLEIFMLTPLFLLLSVGTGIVTGVAAHFLCQRAGSALCHCGLGKE
ncbi:MAG: Gx transporter family protein [bacterium]